MKITSTVFEHKGPIPQRYTCEGLNVNPPLNIEGIPPEAKSLALIVSDPDAKNGAFDHWIVWNVPVHNTIKENTVPGIEGKNGFGKTGYAGPCPPSGTHRYFFRVFALDAFLDLKEGAGKKEVEEAIKDHLLDSAEITGLYKSGGKKLTKQQPQLKK